MLDPTLCTRPLSQWNRFTLWVFHRMTDPVHFNILAIPYWKRILLGLCLALLVLAWLTRRVDWRPWLKRLAWRRTRIRWMIGGVLACLVMLSPPVMALAHQALVLPLPADTGEVVDAIVVLDRGPGLRSDRVEVVAQLWRAGRAPRIFASGRGDAVEMVALLKAKGIPERAIDREACSRTTEENAQFTALVLNPAKVRRILLITDGPHLLRSKLTFEQKGFEVIPHACSLPNLSYRKWVALLLREYGGLISYGLLGRLSDAGPA